MKSKNCKFTSLASFSTFFGRTKKGIGPVVATALLIVIAVVAVVGFQGWFDTYSTSMFVKVEQESRSSDNLKIEGVIGDILYLRSGGDNLTLLKITSSNGEEMCSFSGSGDINNSGLVGWWKLDDEDSIIKDYSGNGNHGKLYGNTRLLLNFDDETATDRTAYENNGILMNGVDCSQIGISGKGCLFDGVDDYINFENDDNFNFNYSDFSINVWVKANNYSAKSCGDSIISKLNVSSPRKGFDLRLSGDLFPGKKNQIFFWLGLNDSSGYTIWGPIINDSMWRNIIISVDRKNSMKMYIDGELISNLSIFEYENINNYNGNNFYIGKNDYEENSVFNGSIDEVAIYSKALSSEEIKDLYNSQKAKFIEFKDSKLDKAVEFDGIDDYIEIQDDDTLGLNNMSFIISGKFYFKNGYSAIISKGEVWDPRNYWVGYQVIQSNPFFIFTFSNASTPYPQNSGYPHRYKSNFIGKYTNFVVQYDNYTSNLYINGNLLNSYFNDTVFLGHNNYPLTFGTQYDAMNDIYEYWLNGEIDEVRIYNRTLTQEEISKLYWNSIASTNQGINQIELSSCNLQKGKQYNVVTFTNNQKAEGYFIAK